MVKAYESNAATSTVKSATAFSLSSNCAANLTFSLHIHNLYDHPPFSYHLFPPIIFKCLF